MPKSVKIQLLWEVLEYLRYFRFNRSIQIMVFVRNRNFIATIVSKVGEINLNLLPCEINGVQQKKISFGIQIKYHGGLSTGKM